MHSGSFGGDPQVSTFQQYVVIRADYVAKVRSYVFHGSVRPLTTCPWTQVPRNITLEDASTIPLTVTTAALGLYGKRQEPFSGIGLTPPWAEGGRGKYAVEPILIISGASGVGQHGTCHLPS